MKKFIFAMLFACSISATAQWTQVIGPYGANVTALISNGTDTYAATLGAGVYKLPVGATMWTRHIVGLSNLSVRALATGSNFIFAGTDAGVFKLFNGDTVWQAASNGLTDRNVSAMTYLNGALIVGTQAGTVFISIDNGANWSTASNGLASSPIQSIAFTSSTLFVGTKTKGVYRSTNGGTSWITANTNLPAGPNIRAFTVTPTGIYAGVFSGSTSGSIYLSKNNGASWTLTQFGIQSDSVLSLASNGTAVYLGVSSGVSSNRGVYKSLDSGASWIYINTEFPINTNFSVNALLVTGNSVFAGTDVCGVFESTNSGTSWAPVSHGFTNITTTSIVEHDSTVVIGTTIMGLYYSANHGAQWGDENFFFDGSPVGAIAFANSAIYFCASGAVYSTSNLGASSRFIANLPGGTVSTFFVGGMNLFAVIGYGSGFQVSSDTGHTWINAGTGLPAGTLSVHALIADNNNVLYAGVGSVGVYTSTNNGTSWSVANTGISNATVYSLAVLGNIVFAGTDRGLYSSNNGGATWLPALQGIAPAPVYSLAVGSPRIFAGMDSGKVFSSIDNGTTWNQLSFGMTPVPVVNLVEHGALLFAGLAGDGVWQLPVSSRISAVDSAQFDTLICETRRGVNVIVQNTGTLPLIITSAHFNGANASEFTLTEPQVFPDTIAAGRTILFTVYFTPSVPGTKSASISIYSNDQIFGHNPKTINLLADYETYGESVSDTLTTVTLHAGTAADTSILIASTGTGPDTLISSTIVLDAPWLTSPANYYPHTVAAGKTAHVPFHLQAAKDTGSHRGDMLLSFQPCSTSNSAGVIMRTVSGIVQLPSAIELGSIEVGSSVCDTIKLFNRGNGQLHLSNESLSSGDLKLYRISSFFYPILAPGDSDYMVVCWTPADTGVQTATLHFETDDSVSASSSFDVILNGRGKIKTDVAPSQTIPHEIFLTQNIPNPATSTAKINFEITRSGHVQLIVRDMIGNVVANVGDENLPAGSHIWELNVGGLPAGVYCYSLIAEGKMAQRMMTVVH